MYRQLFCTKDEERLRLYKHDFLPPFEYKFLRNMVKLVHQWFWLQYFWSVVNDINSNDNIASSIKTPLSILVENLLSFILFLISDSTSYSGNGGYMSLISKLTNCSSSLNFSSYVFYKNFWIYDKTFSWCCNLPYFFLQKFSYFIYCRIVCVDYKCIF